MLHLKNIKIENNTAQAEYSPEDSGWWGRILVDLKSEEIISCDRNPEYRFMHPGHARQQLVKMAKSNDTRTECMVMWY